MGYLAVWKILEEIMTDFKKKSIIISQKIMNDLKSARTTISVSKAKISDVENLQKIEEYLTNVESYLISEGQKIFGTRYVNEQLKRLEDARKGVDEEEQKEARFLSGLPREHEWIRVKPSDQLPIEKMKKLAEELRLSFRTQNDGSFVVYGKNEEIGQFIRKMTIEYRLKNKRKSQTTSPMKANASKRSPKPQ